MNMDLYTGVIVEESLEDNLTLNNLAILRIQITAEQNPQDRWHLYTVAIPRENIPLLKDKVKEGWYMHFWRDDELIVIFKHKLFILNNKSKRTWKEAVEYGLRQGIPAHQLDFAIEE